MGVQRQLMHKSSMGRSTDEGDTSGKASEDMMMETQPMLNLSVAQVHQVINSMRQQSKSQQGQTTDGQQADKDNASTRIASSIDVGERLWGMSDARRK